MRKLIAALSATALLGALAIPAFGATKTIQIGDNFFKPKTATVKKGTTVKWVWKGDKPHNVVVTSGPVKFHSKVKTSGSYVKKLSKAGTYRILCTIHADEMKLTLKVK
jgi:plastocyanin